MKRTRRTRKLKLRRRRRFIRRTGRLRHRRAMGGRFKIGLLPRKKGYYNRGNELKYTNTGAADTPIQPFDNNPPNYVILSFSFADPNSQIMQQGIGRHNFIGTKINLISIQFSFCIQLNTIYNIDNTVWNWPQTAAEARTFLQYPQNLCPTIRVTLLWDKQGKEVGSTPTTIGYPVLGQGFQAPYDTDFWKVISDKYYKLKVPMVTEGNTFGNCMNPKTTIYMQKRLPLKMTADMELVDPEFQVWNLAISKRFFICVTTDMQWRKQVGDLTVYPIWVSQCSARCYFTDP